MEAELSIEKSKTRRICNENAIQIFLRDKKILNTVVPDDELRCQEKVRKSDRRKK